MDTLVLEGSSLTIEKIRAFLGIGISGASVTISEQARDRAAKARQQIDEWLVRDKKVIYGITTGLGKLKDHMVGEAEQERFQKNILYSHAVGLGDCFDSSVSRLAMLIRANVFCRGGSGVRTELIDRLLLFINNGISPCLPQIGSLGVGDLQPMAHMGLCLAGYPEGEACWNGETGGIRELLPKAGIAPVDFPLAAREALALMSGSTVLLAAAVQSCMEAVRLVELADMAAALSLEAVRGEKAAFDPRIHEARGFETQLRTACSIGRLIEGSGWMTEEGRGRLGEKQPRVQDSVSFRSTCQVHGAVKDVLGYVSGVLEQEMNASTDNPLLLECGDGFECLSGGNFHGVPIAYGMDFLGIVLTDLAVLSERRSARLLDPVMSYGLPGNLVGGRIGLNTGYALVQANAAALVGEMRILAAPASIGSIPSKSNQEDHNSMGMGAVRKLMQIVNHLKKVLAVEFLCAVQAIGLIEGQMAGLSLGKGTEPAYRLLRSKAELMKDDHYVKKDLLAVLELLNSNEMLDCVQ